MPAAPSKRQSVTRTQSVYRRPRREGSVYQRRALATGQTVRAPLGITLSTNPNNPAHYNPQSS